MTTSDMVIHLCGRLNISIAEVLRHIGQHYRTLIKKLKINTVTIYELIEIENVFQQSFTWKDGTQIKINIIEQRTIVE